MSEKSPLKMNMNLVRGARQVADAEGKRKLIKSKAATNLAGYLAQGISKVVQKRNNEFNDIMEQQLSKEGLSDEEWQETYNALRKRRAAYVYLNKKERMDFERNLIEGANEKTKDDARREEIADAAKDADIEEIDDSTIQDIVKGEITATKDDKGRVGYALRSDALQEFVIQDENGNNRLKSYRGAWEDERFTVSKDGKFKTDKFGNKYTNNEAGFRDFQRSAKLYWIRKAKETGDNLLMYNSTTGKREYLTPEEAEALMQDKEKFVTHDEIKQHIASRSIDTNTKNNINVSIVSGAEKARNLKEGDSIEFDVDEAKTRYSKMIDNTDDIHKLATKNYVGNTSFKQDLTEKLVSMKYTEMGIDKSVVESFDPNSDGDNATISSADANVIVEKIMEDEGMLKGYLTDYFTMYEAREFKNNIPSNLKLDAALTKTRNETALMPFINNYLPEGYTAVEAIAGMNYAKITAPDGRTTKIYLGKGADPKEQIDRFVNDSGSVNSTEIQIQGGDVDENGVYMPGDDYVQ